ncbi:MAG: DUF2285 domain-containing protein [Nitrospira sp.]|nr:DUF2285 domain-containing protein [Nitrospira sp.]
MDVFMRLVLREPDDANELSMLSAFADARTAGASHRDIAELLFGALRVPMEWSGPSDSLQSRVRRYVKLSENLANGGWRELLMPNPQDSQSVYRVEQPNHDCPSSEHLALMAA